ncbi:hypothetical protein [Methylocapsa sp. S129]|uniref:hypothetical protein n=1 Tax=Methylocapsa sp. S129 TaxID=1641869 RepID=UPI00131B6ECC|nr:hypothetical protein [Methylocapsa sp. S129]
MEKVEFLDDEGEALGLSLREVQSTTRRQLFASLVAAVVIAVIAGLMAVRPAYRDTTEAAAPRFATVQQPSWATPPGQRVAAAVRHGIELP